MVLDFLDDLLYYSGIKKRSAEHNRILHSALNREYVVNGALSRDSYKVQIPKDIRKDYYKSFEKFTSRKSITFCDSDSTIIFDGVDKLDMRLKLEYDFNSVLLSLYYFPKNSNMHNFENEIDVMKLFTIYDPVNDTSSFSTHLDFEKYNVRTKPVNDKIDAIVEHINRSKHIPRLDLVELQKLPSHDPSSL